ncbi:hypothetical protein AAE478_010268 [Parahypoxylon ruwenzoriense]
MACAFVSNKNNNRNNRKAPIPDESVHEKEDAIVAGNDNSALSPGNFISEKDRPLRPSYGTRGRNVVVWANYVEMEPDKNLILHLYTISVDPKAIGKKLIQIIKLFYQSKSKDFQKVTMTDFKTTFISRRNLSDEDIVQEVTYCEEGGNQPSGKAQKYKIQLSFHSSISISTLKEYFSSTNPDAAYDRDETIRALNIFLSHHSRFTGGLITIGASKTFSNQKVRSLELGLEVRRGFYASTRLVTSRLIVNVNVSHGVFYEENSLLNLMRKYQAKEGERNDLRRLEIFLKNLKVKPIHTKEGKAVHGIRTISGLARIDDGKDLDHKPSIPHYGADSKTVKFRRLVENEEELTSVFEFFGRSYAINLTAANMPVVNVGTTRKPIYLPPELCKVLPGQRLNVRSDLIQRSIQNDTNGCAIRNPIQNITDIRNNGLKMVGLSTQNEKLKEFGARVSTELITVHARVLEVPGVIYGKKQRVKPEDTSWNLLKINFSEPRKLSDWTYIIVSPRKNPNSSGNGEKYNLILDTLKKQLRAAGNSVDDPIPLRYHEFAFEKVGDDDDIRSIFRPLSKGSAPLNLKLLFIILEGNTTSMYGSIKRLGDIKYGIKTICVDGKNINYTKSISVLRRPIGNITMKFNLKLGGANHCVDFTGLLNFDQTMVVGIDVTHPTESSDADGSSVAGMVASIDSSLAQWPAVLRHQNKSRQEMVSGLKDMLTSQLKFWVKKNRHRNYPQNILVYRDGVSEGQYSQVLQQELPLLREACKTLYPASDQKNGKPRFTLVIVGKRHHTRFYPTNPEDVGGRNNNLNTPPGTVVDRGVTEARNWDFYLQAHAAGMGTARAAHYFVLKDEIFRPLFKDKAVDALESVTQRLCYLNGRTTKAVGICVPAFYADLACDRAHIYLRGLPYVPPPSASKDGNNSPDTGGEIKIHPNLEDTMFYI